MDQLSLDMSRRGGGDVTENGGRDDVIDSNGYKREALKQCLGDRGSRVSSERVPFVQLEACKVQNLESRVSSKKIVSA